MTLASTPGGGSQNRRSRTTQITAGFTTGHQKLARDTCRILAGAGKLQLLSTVCRLPNVLFVVLNHHLLARDVIYTSMYATMLVSVCL